MVLQIDPAYEPRDTETREVFGFTMTQKRNTAPRHQGPVRQDPAAPGGAIPDDVLETLLVATIALKYTQSNSVCIAYDGQVIGMGAGQQSRVHCTRLACGKADKWLLQQHPKTLALKIKADLPKPEKANVVDYFLLWDELSDVEKAQAARRLDADPEPHHARGARRVGQGASTASACRPTPSSPSPTTSTGRRRPTCSTSPRPAGRRATTWSPGRGGIRDDDGPHGAAAVPALDAGAARREPGGAPQWTTLEPSTRNEVAARRPVARMSEAEAARSQPM